MLASFWRRLHAREKRWVFALILAHVLLITLPYLWAWSITPAGYHFTGMLFSADDQNVHLSWARQAAEGNLFSRDLFTTESLSSGERPLFFNALTAIIGVLSKTGLPLVFVYHVLRVVFAIIALCAVYGLVTLLTDDRHVKVLSLMLVAFSSGAGYLAPLLQNRIFIDRPDGSFPMMPEAFFFPSSFLFALNIAALALLLLTYNVVLATPEKPGRWPAVAGFFCALLLSNIHTYDTIPLVITLFLWAIVARRFHKSTFAAVFAGALLPVAYQFFVFRNSEEFRLKALTDTPAPPLLDVLLSYGLLIPLALAGAMLALRTLEPRGRRTAQLLIIWTLTTLVCIYLPVSFARKMIEGLHLPLCLLAAFGAIALLRTIASRPLRLASAAAILILCCTSTLQFVAWCAFENTRDATLYNQTRGEFMPPLYLTRGDAGALRFLNTTVPAQRKSTFAVLCGPKLGNLVPRETGMFTYIGHWAETLHVQSAAGKTGKFEQTLNFYAGKLSDAESLQWLQKNHIGYVIVGHYERARYGAVRPPNLKNVHNENGTTIYVVP